MVTEHVQILKIVRCFFGSKAELHFSS